MDGTRRDLMAAGFLLAAGVLLSSGERASSAPAGDPLTAKIEEMERRLGARLGAMIRDTHTGRAWSHRKDERFPMASTFKAFACAAVLARVDAGEETLERRVPVRKGDLVTYSPVTEKHVGRAMTLGELCKATTGLSDNTAANLLLGSIGGPDGFTAFMRSIGDEATRLDRYETALNEAAPGDPRDTTTPAAAARSLHALLTGDILSESSRRQLEEWLAGNEVGGALLRAGLPAHWRIADRTGAGGHGTRSIIAMIWPPARKPVVATVFITGTGAAFDERNAAIAEIGRTLADVLEI